MRTLGDPEPAEVGPRDMVNVSQLRKHFHDGRSRVTACDGVTFEVPAGRFFTLLGPSGCGKTTTLRSVAGLERPDGGDIAIDGAVVFSARHRTFVPPERRDIGMVFQSYAIWPHMTVFDNAAFPLRAGRSRVPAAEAAARVHEVLATVGLLDVAHRPATNLSGGQQQRLAFARALVRRPKVLLLDEPLSNLDAKLRERMRLELRALQRRLGITTIYVTHDQVEALAMSNLVAVMHDGRIVQVGAPREIYERPASRFVADFIGSTNLLPGRIAGAAAPGLYRVDTPGGPLVCAVPDGAVPGGAAPGREVLISVRPEDVTIGDRPQPDGGWEVLVDQVVFLGECVDCRLDARGQVLRARAHPALRVRRGDRVFVSFHPDRCIAMAPEDAPVPSPSGAPGGGAR